MQNSNYVLAIDNGTQSVRAMVFDSDGQLVAKSKVDIEPYFSTQPGYAEQQPDYFWSALCQACQELWPQLNFPRQNIKAVSVTTQRATVVPMGKDGKPLRAAISWLDQRQVDSKPQLGALESFYLQWLKPRILSTLFMLRQRLIGLPKKNLSYGLRWINFYYCPGITTIS